ncbi:MAG: head maturation protease, ClpP-related [Christensenellales bacterium]
MPKILQRNNYCLARNSAKEVEITAYGEIVESRPRNYWTDKEEDGPFIVMSEFLDDLNKAIEDGVESVKIRINSLGGDAGVSLTIHNRLRELSAKGIETSCVVDGMAMSGGSIIMCACDKVSVYPTSIVMIHKCWSFMFGDYNADELRAEATKKDAIDQTIMEAYKRKCNSSDTVINHMMAAETYMSGREAVEKGFADELLDAAESTPIAASADRSAFFVKGRRIPIGHGITIPDSIPISTSVEDDIKINPTAEAEEKGGNTMASNLAELRNENAALAEVVENEIRADLANDTANAVNAERQRIQEIDEIANLFDPEIVAAAKYGNPCSAAEMSYRAAKASAAAGTAFMQNLFDDSRASNSGRISSASNNNAAPDTLESRMQDARAKVEALLGKKEG